MELFLGVGVLAASTLLFAWGFGAHRRPVPARWTRLPGVSMLLCVALTLSFPIGIGFVISAAVNPSFDIGLLELEAAALSLALLAAAILFTPRLIRPGRTPRPVATPVTV